MARNIKKIKTDELAIKWLSDEHVGPKISVKIKTYTLDSGIDVAPGIHVAHPLKNFHITNLILFYINLGIPVIFDFIFSSRIFKN